MYWLDGHSLRTLFIRRPHLALRNGTLLVPPLAEFTEQPLALLVGEARGCRQLFPQKRSKFASEHCLVL
jgi:hypothetical protein